jgi:hypothetical protein
MSDVLVALRRVFRQPDYSVREASIETKEITQITASKQFHWVVKRG